jgi:hypothetical protein
MIMNEEENTTIFETLTRWEESLFINSRVKWYKRIWYIISNPFLYIFQGKIRY